MSDNQGGKVKMSVSGEGNAKNPEEEVVESLQDAVEYGGGVESDPMEEIDSESQDDTLESSGEEPGDEPVETREAVPAAGQSAPVNEIDKFIDPEKVKEDPVPGDAVPKFDERETQDARTNSENEGGAVKNKTTGPTMSQSEKNFEISEEGGTLKPPADMSSDSIMGKFEVTGFDVEYEVNKETHVAQIRDYFPDVETAFASVNSDKYLMPMKNGYKIATIRNGAPTISFNERTIYIYKDGKWNRV